MMYSFAMDDLFFWNALDDRIPSWVPCLDLFYTDFPDVFPGILER